MNFKDRTLELDAIQSLFQCRVETVKPYVLMTAPVFVLMKRNKKLVCVKAPLDFFTADEIQSMVRYEVFYLPKAAQEAGRFQTAAKLHRAYMAINSEQLARAPFEISNEIIKTVPSLWGKDLLVDPFFAAIYTDELCGRLDPTDIENGRELAVVKHEHGILLGGMLIFVLAHLGMHNLDVLKKIRQQVYSRTVNGETWQESKISWEAIARDLQVLIFAKTPISLKTLASFSSEWARKLASRLKRVEQSPAIKKFESLNLSQLGDVLSEAA